MEKITGKNNEIIKDVKKLFISSRQRRAQGLFVLEGARLVFDVLNSFYEVKYFLITQSAFEKYEESSRKMAEKSVRSYIISDDIAFRLSDTENSQGVFAVCKMKENKERIDFSGKYVALDNIQDPGNMGAVIRTAEALGIDGIIIGGGCDVFNPKVLRASMGSVLRMNITVSENFINTLEYMKKSSMVIYGTSPDSSLKKITEADFGSGCVCIIGNEANGISGSVKAVCDELITIPMLGRAESLNASAAAAIAMWEMLR